MSNIYRPKNFVIEELVPPELFENWKDMQSKVWTSMDYRAIKTLQNLRDKFGRMRMNNWYKEGPNKYKGLRPMHYKSLTYLSQHKWFKAFDPTPLDTDIDVIRTDILNNPFSEEYKWITCIEMDVPWLHFDTRNWNKKEFGILKVNP